MHVASTTRAFEGLTFPEVCEQLTDLEFDRIEVCLDDGSTAWKAAEVGADPDHFAARFRELTRLLPVAIYLLHDVGRDEFRGICRFAKLLKITQITVPASPLGAPYNTEIDRLRDLVAMAGQEGVLVSLKTESGTLTEDPHTAVELCQGVKELGLTLDPSYYHCGPGRVNDYDLVFKHVYHVHLRDTSDTELQVPAGLGEIDYNRLITQLSRHGYNRTLSVDLLPQFPDADSRGLEFRKLRMLLESLL